MSRTNNEDNSAFNQHFASGKFSHSHKVLTGDVVLTQNGSLVNFFDPNGTNRTCTLPVLDKGRFYVVSHVGTANTITVNSSTAVLVTSLVAGDTALMFASDNKWVALRGWAALTVFTNTVNGLVPAPNSAVPGSLFLRDDGQWGQVQVTGIVDAFKFITDGTTTAIGSGPDTLRVRSSTGKVTAVVTNNEVVFGDNVNFSVNEAAVDHNALLNFSSNKHIDHTAVTLTAGLGLSGGGDISASRSFAIDLSEFVLAVPVLTDYVPEYDAVDGQFRSTWTQVNAVFVHNNLVGYVANEHINHAGVSIVAGSGIAGGGTIETSRTISLDINGLTVDTIVTGDFLPFYDISGVDNNKVTFANFNAALDHNALAGYVANEHINHTTVTLTAGAGLTGGGTIAANRTFDVGAGVGITVNADDVALNINGLTADTLAVGDFFPFYDISGSDHNKVTLANLNTALDHNTLTNYVANQHIDHTGVSISTSEGLQGGGTIAATRSLKLDVNGLVVDVPDTATDYLPFYDASTALHKKVLFSGLPAGGGSVLYNTSQSLTVTEKSQARANIDALKFNYILNGAGAVNQEGTTSITDGVYDFDQWIGLTQTAAVTSSVVTAAENGMPMMMRLLQAQVTAQRFGRIQWIENNRCRVLRGSAVVLAARVRMSAATTLRYAIIEWTGTADAITKDIVLSWTSATFTTGNFFTSTSTTLVAAGSIALAANTLTDITALTGTVSSSMNNLAVFFWTDSTQAQNVTLDISKVGLCEGSVAPAYQMPDYQKELDACQRYWVKTSLSTLGTVSGHPAVSTFSLPVEMRASPAVANVSVGTVVNSTYSNTTMGDNKSGYFQISVSGVPGYILARVDSFNARL